jgi:hypothetical protein
MKNSFSSKSYSKGGLRGLVALVFLVLMLGGSAQAQVSIPGTKVKFTFPSKWKYLNTERVDANTQRYLYYYSDKVVAAKGDTTLPFLRIYVRKNFTAPIFDFVFDRYSKEPYQSLTDYTEGLGLPKSGGMGYVGAYTNVRDKKDYQFRMVYFKVQNTVVEFRLETTKDTYKQMEKEFIAILKSLTF